ncbi:MAG: ABC transporter ATP-binding protein [Propionibacteriaceae bacterium]|jgi:ABC-2 type transport system ATP-binding protein|nr:ABC transporter ATP-binding protein [Propionibacteriaceae bacterium]
MEYAIRTEHLTKSFGAVRALKDLNLAVPTGTVTGFLGPNGAGKSTTIRVLLGLLHADSGEAVLLGGSPWRDAVALHKRLVYVPGDVALWPNLTGGQIIDVLSALSGGVEKARKEEMIERFQLDPRKKAKAYSKGNRQKVALVAALASRAELLILDEPTSGLDPIMEAEFQACIREVKNEGCSVLLSSHIFAEVEKLADTVTIIREGKDVESGTLDQLRHLTRTEVKATFAQQPDSLATIVGIHDYRLVDGEASFAVDHDHLSTVLSAIASLNPGSLTVAPASLEEIFLSHYKEDVGEFSEKNATQTRSTSGEVK